MAYLSNRANALALPLALLLAAALPAACGGTDVSNRPDSAGLVDGGADARPNIDALTNHVDADGRFAVQILTDDCAPNDGPAIRMVLAPDQTDCTTAGFGESVEIILYRGDVVPPLTVTFSPIEPNGYGTYCPGPGPCYGAQSGAVTFDSFDRNGETVGSFTLQLQNSTVEGNFVATWCTPSTPPVCG